MTGVAIVRGVVVAVALDAKAHVEIPVADEAVHRLNQKQRAELHKKHIGFVFQSFNLLPRMNALENVELPLLLILLLLVAARVVSADPGAAGPGTFRDLGVQITSRTAQGTTFAKDESGRDVDLLFFMTDAEGAPIDATAMRKFGRRGVSVDDRWVKAERVRFDVDRNWELVKALLTAPEADVQYIFISEALAQILLDHARAIGELLQQIPAPDIIVHSTSSGGTQAGLVAGCRIFGLPTRVIGISADDPGPVIAEKIVNILRGLEGLLELPSGSLGNTRELEVDAGLPSQTDRLEDTVDYGAVCQAVEDTITAGHVQLLEHLALVDVPDLRFLARARAGQLLAIGAEDQGGLQVVVRREAGPVYDDRRLPLVVHRREGEALGRSDPGAHARNLSLARACRL